MPQLQQPGKPARPWIAIYVAAGVMMIISLGVLGWLAAQSRQAAGARTVAKPAEIPVERYQLLSHFEPPPYHATTAPAPRDFQAAMQRYMKHDYAGAIPVLRGSSFPEARFYLGICLLLTNDISTGVRELQDVVESGSALHREEARYYLAKGLLEFGDIGRAKAQLENVHGDLEKQARALLAQIE